MAFDRKKYYRRSIRIPEYDYSTSGAYFITVVSYHRECIFGEIKDDVMTLSAFGEIVQSRWFNLPNHYTHVTLDQFVIMPNHIHGVIVLKSNQAKSQYQPLSEIVRALKSFSTRQINTLRQISATSVWQRNYYERVIRNERELKATREYVINNPLKWALDKEHPKMLR
jgi:REP element-mobilizing transposase RayT